MSTWTLAALYVSTLCVRNLFWDGDTLWAATSGGLEAWDPGTWTRTDQVTDFPTVSLLSVGEYRGRLTVGTDGAGAFMRDEAGKWIPLRTGETPEDLRVRAVLPDWLVTAGGLVYPDGDRLPGLVVDAVEWNGRVVAGTLEGKLVVWDGETQVETIGAPISDLAWVDGGVSLAYAGGSALWDGNLHRDRLAATVAGDIQGGADGALWSDGRLVSRVPAPVTALSDVGEGIAVGTPQGIYMLDERGMVHLDAGSSNLCGPFVGAVTRWQGRVVAGSFDRGACVLENGRWKRIEGLPSEMINDVLADGPTLWLATGAGLVRWEGWGTRPEVIGPVPGDAGRNAPGTHLSTVNGLARGQRLWIADLAGPISVDGRGAWRRYRYSVFGTSFQRIVACGAEAWAASEDAGLSHFDGVRWTNHDAETGLPDDWVMAVACDGPDSAWAGMYQDGVWRWDGQGWIRIEGLPDAWVLSMAWDGEAIWVGTYSGLFRMEGENWESMPGLPSPAVHDIFVDGDGVLVGTEAGIVEYRKDR